MIEVHEVHFKIGRAAILHGVSALLRPGEITAIIGPNGSGKTTLLRVMAGLETVVEQGQVLWNGLPAGGLSERERAAQRAYVTQVQQTVVPFTVRDFIAFGGYIHERSVPASRREAELNQILEEFGLWQYIDRSVATLSGGERQRTLLAKALYQLRLAGDPQGRFIFLDEPANHLDLRHRQELLQRLIALRNQGYGVAVVLHELSDVHLIADHVVCMNHGRIVRAGRPDFTINATLLHDVFGLSEAHPFFNPRWLSSESRHTNQYHYGIQHHEPRVG